MIRLFALLSVSMLVAAFVFAPETSQNTGACCTVSAVEEFARLADDPKFREAHALPRPLTEALKKGEMVSFPTVGEKPARAFVVNNSKRARKVIFMIHEWWGLNEHIRQEAVKYQEALGKNVMVVALDLYDGNVATTREEASKYMQEVSEVRAREIIHGAYNYAGTNRDIATIGWCFGGGWSLQTAILLGQNVEACVMYYGMPEKATDKLKRLKAPVLGVFAEKDKWITPEVVDTFAEKLKSLNHPVEIKMYDADHAFANPTGDRYNEAAAQDARKHTLEFLREELNL